ncbi:hypothetical protein GCM10011374_04600 [Kocuria dechangensis]|uniref:Uncharacterized protein n=1 Tax=Kocuria dechangensis TaxID=1176249 RepID=A0A917GGS4_9MICC|nr:hypothetical protein GCM10011374_04600 [Kocuria dechangensis]
MDRGTRVLREDRRGAERELRSMGAFLWGGGGPPLCTVPRSSHQQTRGRAVQGHGRRAGSDGVVRAAVRSGRGRDAAPAEAAEAAAPTAGAPGA